MVLEIKKDIQRAIAIIRKLNEAFFMKTLFGFKGLPEEILPKGMVRGSPEHLLYITFTSSIAYLRREEDLWKAATRTYEDKETRYVLNPKEVLSKPSSEVKSALNKYNYVVNVVRQEPFVIGKIIPQNKLASRENDFEIWLNLSKALVKFDSSIEKLFEAHDFDAFEVLKFFTETPYSNSFPEYRKKTKVIIWLAKMERNAKFSIRNLNALPLASGSHIIRSTFRTGAISGKINSFQTDIDDLIINFWQEVSVEGKGVLSIYPLQFQVYLWVLSRFGCSPRGDAEVCPQFDNCPVNKFCTPGTITILDKYITIDTKQ